MRGWIFREKAIIAQGGHGCNGIRRKDRRDDGGVCYVAVMYVYGDMEKRECRRCLDFLTRLRSG